MTIEKGETVPSATFKTITPDGPTNVTTDDLFKGRKVVIFGVPGAFTPTCSMNHLPGFLENRDAILAKGVDEIAVVAANDQFVMSAWAKASGGEDKISFLADGNADFARAAGLDADFSKGGMGTRYKRFSAIVEDGVVKELNIEETPGTAEISGAARILEQL